MVLGITFSESQMLNDWRRELRLDLALLCDADRTVAMQYGAAQSAVQEKAGRVSVLIGEDGRVLKTYEVGDPANHADEVIADLDRI